MKVTILSNWGGKIPKLLKPFTNNGNNWRWGPVIQFIENNSVIATDTLPSETTSKIICYPGNDIYTRTYLFKEENITVTIIDVDTTRPWTIGQYDGSEYVQYLDYDIIDKKVNFCELPRK